MQDSSQTCGLQSASVGHHSTLSQAHPHQQTTTGSLDTRRSGNPFASEDAAARMYDDSAGQMAGPLRHAASGNPFVAAVQTIRESKLSGSHDVAFGEMVIGNLPMADYAGQHSRAHLNLDTVASGRSPAQSQQAAQSAVPGVISVMASPPASPRLLKNPEMSPLQNGLIRYGNSSNCCM